MRIVSTFGNPGPACDQTLLDLWKGLGRRVKAVHAASRTLEVHYVELFVQKCVEIVRSYFQARRCTFKHLLIHIFNLLCVPGDFKELFQLIM